MAKLTLQVRTHDNLLDLLAHGQSGDWVVGQGREADITDVQIVNWDGTQMIRATFDRTKSYRPKNDSKRLVLVFSDPQIVNCKIEFDAPRSVVRYIS
jgi:hypothetical protein